MTQQGGAGGGSGGGSGIQALSSPNGSVLISGDSTDTTLESARVQYPAEGWYFTVYEGVPVSNNSFTAGWVTFVPIDTSQKITIETIALLATGTLTAGSALGLYSDVGGLPGALLVSSGVTGTGTITWSPNYVTSDTVWIGLYTQAGTAIDSLSTATYPIQPSNPRYNFNPPAVGGSSFSGAAFCMVMTGQSGLPAQFVFGSKIQFCPRYQVKILPA